MKSLLNKFMEVNPEQFNEDFIKSRDDNQIVEEINAVFESLKVIPGLSYDPKDIVLITDESSFAPIMQEKKYYKPLQESRMNRLRFTVSIEGKKITNEIILPKTLNNTFIINEGKRYFLVWQIVDSVTFGYGKGTTFKTNVHPIKVETQGRYSVNEYTTGKEYQCDLVDAYMYGAFISPILLYMNKYSLDSFKANNMETITSLKEFTDLRDESLVSKIGEQFGVDIRFSDNPEDLIAEGRSVFQTFTSKENKKTKTEVRTNGISYSIPTEFISTEQGRMVLSVVNYLKLQTTKSKKKTRVLFSYDDLINPSYWVDMFGSIFNSSNDIYKKYDKVKQVMLSFEGLITDTIRKKSPIRKEDKQDIYAVIRYLILNLSALKRTESQDLSNKRIRLYEYLLYPLYEYFTKKTQQIINSASKNLTDVEKMFTSLSPMHLLKECIDSEWMMLFDSSNEINLFGALLRFTYHGPQGYAKTVSDKQRSLHPSYTGRISLVSATPGKPGTTGSFTPWLEVYPGGYFTKQNLEDFDV